MDKELGRPTAIQGYTKIAQFTFKFSLLNWLRSQAKREGVVPSVIVNRALERERREPQQKEMA